jgi:hypothetical protein
MHTSVTKETCNKTSVGKKINARQVLERKHMQVYNNAICQVNYMHNIMNEWMDLLEDGLGPKCMDYSLDFNHSLSTYIFLF